jgi:Protein of unknown function (DUF3263)
MTLTERERSILEFERSWWTEPGPKELAIRERFDLSATRYYQLLAELVDSDDALEYDPLVIRRLRRMRDRRRRARFEGPSASEPSGR